MDERLGLEDLITAAANQAISKGKQMHADTVRDLTGGLPLPGFFNDALAKLTGTGAEDKGEEGIKN